MSPATPLRRRVDELLADGEWHPRARVVAEAMAVVAPGRAVRHVERQRRRKRAATANPATGRQGDDFEVGARDLTARTIRSAIRSGAIETRQHPETRRVDIRQRRPE